MRQHAQPHSATYGKLLLLSLSLSLSDISLSLKPYSGNEASFTVHSYPKSTNLIRDQEWVSSLSVINTAELPYISPDENCTPPIPDQYHYSLRVHKQINNHTRQDLRYQTLPVSRINNSLLNSTFIRKRVPTSLTQTTTELLFEVTVKFIGLNPHPLQLQFKFEAELFPVLLL